MYALSIKKRLVVFLAWIKIALKIGYENTCDFLSKKFVKLKAKSKSFNPLPQSIKEKITIAKPQRQPIEDALTELKRELIFVDLFNILLNSIIGFLAGLVITTVFNIGWDWAFLPAFAVLIYFAVKYFRQRKLIAVETRVPELKERLRTAADNVNKTNEITSSLKDDVVKDMKKVETTLFIDIEGIGVRLFSIAVVAFIIIILSFLNLTFDFQFAPIISNPISTMHQMMFPQDVSPNATLNFREGNISSAFGNKTNLIKLGEDKLELQVNPLQSELNFDDIKDASQQNFNPPVYPKDISTSYDASYTENIAKKNQAVVKSYFEQISG